MFGIDKGDQMRVHIGGFSNKAHFQKWYKKQFLALLDCMLMNTNITWNLSSAMQTDRSRNKLSHHEFLASVAKSYATMMIMTSGLISQMQHLYQWDTYCDNTKAIHIAEGAKYVA